MDFSIIIDNIGLYFQGLWMTVLLVSSALVLGLVLAVPLGVAAASRNWWVRGPVFCYSYFFRGTPLLVQMYMLYYGLGQFEAVQHSLFWPILREAYWCALIAFTLNTAAYTIEILRGAIVATAHGEIEAAKACGMSWFTMYRRIILPGAFRRALPAYGNEVIFMLHGSAIASVITIVDLTGAARIINSRYYSPYEAFLTAAAFYMALTFTIVYVFKRVERRWFAHLRPRGD
jgi:arginine/ornithine transport system permease protein